MKRRLFVLLFLLLIPIKTFALEEKEYNVCKNGCEYNELETVFGEIQSFSSNAGYDIIINIQDQETYHLSTQYQLNKRRTVWEYGELYRRITNLTINGNGAHVTQDSNWSLSIGVKEKLEIKHLNMEIGPTSLASDRGEIIFEDVNISTPSIGVDHNTPETTIKDSVIKAEVTVDRATLNNLEVEGSLRLSDPTSVEDIEVKGQIIISQKENVEESYTFKNINIDANNKPYGLSFVYEACRGNDTNYGLENVTIKNASVSAIYRMRNTKNLLIKNSDLSDNACSIHLETLDLGYCDMGYTNRFKPELKLLDFSVNANNPDTVIQNSKVCCALSRKGNIASYHDDINITGQSPISIMYFDKTNTWTKPISRGEEENDNVIELDNNIILIEQTNKDIISLNVEKEVDLSKYFNSLVSDIEWTVEDESILTIQNGKIIPKKIGETNIIGRSDKDAYYLNIKITEERNPNTVTNLKVIIGLICLLLLLEITIHFGKKKARE